MLSALVAIDSPWRHLANAEYSRLGVLADHTATQYDRLFIGIILCPSVRPSVTLCIGALRVGVHG